MMAANILRRKLSESKVSDREMKFIKVLFSSQCHINFFFLPLLMLFFLLLLKLLSSHLAMLIAQSSYENCFSSFRAFHPT